MESTNVDDLRAAPLDRLPDGLGTSGVFTRKRERKRERERERERDYENDIGIDIDNDVGIGQSTERMDLVNFSFVAEKTP